MEHIDGEILGERITGGTLSISDTLPLFIDIAHGLEAAHEAGIVHREGITRLVVRAMDNLTAIELSGTEGASLPAFSPDWQFLCYMAGGSLKKIPVQGGVSETIRRVGLSMGLNWNEENIIVSNTGIGTPIQMLHLDTGESTTMAKFAVGEAVHVMPHLLPGFRLHL